jgi:hypothetical protein
VEVSDQEREGTMSDPITAAVPMPSAEDADLAEQRREVPVVESVDEPDLSDVSWETDPADAVEQRLEIGFDDGRDQDADAG